MLLLLLLPHRHRLCGGGCVLLSSVQRLRQLLLLHHVCGGGGAMLLACNACWYKSRDRLNMCALFLFSSIFLCFIASCDSPTSTAPPAAAAEACFLLCGKMTVEDFSSSPVKSQKRTCHLWGCYRVHECKVSAYGIRYHAIRNSFHPESRLHALKWACGAIMRPSF